MDHAGRIERVRGKLADLDCEALLVTDLTNVRYLTGFSGSNGQALVTGDEAFFFSDRRYEQRAKSMVEAAEIQIYPERLAQVLQPLLERLGLSRIGFESTTVTVHERDDLASRLEGIELMPTQGVVQDLRRVKEPEEIDALRRAVAVAEDAFTWLLDELAPGQSERDVALELEVRMRRHGAEDVSFEPIVGSGPLSAHIHHTPSERRFGKGDLVLVDFGALVDGYHSDMTRTVVLGAATDEQHEMYTLVLEAQAAAIDAIAAGAHGRDVDAAARKLIGEAGRAEQFGHGLGHGVGLDIHEEPRLSEHTDHVLRAGEVVTVEPGVYVPGSGGVRIEDCVLVTDSGAEVLGGAPKETLIEL